MQLRESQLEVKSIALERLRSIGNCFLNCEVGFGKTIVAKSIAEELGVPFMVAVPNIILKDQWLKVLGNDSEQVTTKTKNFPNAAVVIRNSMSRIRGLEKYKLVIVDELHTFANSTGRSALENINCEFLLGLSGSAISRKMATFLGQKFDFKFGVVRKTKRRFTYRVLKTNVVRTEGIPYHQLIGEQGSCSVRAQIILDIVKKFPNAKFLILCNRIFTVYMIENLLRSNGVECCSVYSTLNTVNRSARVILGTSAKMAVGMDCPERNALILAGNFVSNIDQIIGRVLRSPTSSSVVYDLVDTHNILEKHSSHRKIVVDELGGRVMERDEPIIEGLVVDDQPSGIKCGICFEKNPVINLPCKHVFCCIECSQKILWKCPICRGDVLEIILINVGRCKCGAVVDKICLPCKEVSTTCSECGEETCSKCNTPKEVIYCLCE